MCNINIAKTLGKHIGFNTPKEYIGLKASIIYIQHERSVACGHKPKARIHVSSISIVIELALAAKT